MRGQERRALILVQSKKVFARTGYAQTSMGELARASHVTEALLYRHFESKKHLYLTVLQEVEEQFLVSFGERVRERARRDLQEALSMLLLDYRTLALSEPEGLQIILSAATEANDLLIIQRVESFISGLATLVSQLLKEAQEQGLLPAHLDLTAAAWGYFSFLFAIHERVKHRVNDQLSEQTVREMNRLWLCALQSG
jgi:AcrR family transcriptional regulator